jgi:HTH-type transcriptional regulator/antitoxin HipB
MAKQKQKAKTKKSMAAVSYKRTPDAINSSLANLGIEIRKERKSRGLSQTTLGALSSVGINFVSQIESGKPTAHIGKVLEVMRTLGLEFTLSHGSNVIRIIDDKD